MKRRSPERVGVPSVLQIVERDYPPEFATDECRLASTLTRSEYGEPEQREEPQDDHRGPASVKCRRELRGCILTIFVYLVVGVLTVWALRTTASALGGNLQEHPGALRFGLSLLALDAIVITIAVAVGVD